MEETKIIWIIKGKIVRLRSKWEKGETENEEQKDENETIENEGDNGWTEMTRFEDVTNKGLKKIVLQT